MKNSIPNPIFGNKIDKISWKKIYEREYGVQYSEVAVRLLAGKVRDHFPRISFDQVVIPGQGKNTIFYIDAVSWINLVEGLNAKYTAHLKKLEDYEKQFLKDGPSYVETAKKIGGMNLRNLSNRELGKFYEEYQDKLYKYSTFAWSGFILNNYIADKALVILDEYIKKANLEDEKEDIHNALLRPERRAAILELQHLVEEKKGNVSKQEFLSLYERFKWLSCLDIQNRPWTQKEFENHIKSFAKTKILGGREFSFIDIEKQLKIKKEDLEYLLMAKRFTYIKDARDDFRRKGVFYAGPLFEEIGRRIKISREDVSFLQEAEILASLDGRQISKENVGERKKGFVLYLDTRKNLVCLQGNEVLDAVKSFGLQSEEVSKEITGRVASRGLVGNGKVVIVKGVNDLEKVKNGDVLVAVATHPDYVPAMRKASAIVTDEGGITSHAAIVSREFAIPCIVGTKNATLLLKDGDRIEVNAIEGKIKIL